MGNAGQQHKGTSEDRIPVTTQFINGRGPDEYDAYNWLVSNPGGASAPDTTFSSLVAMRQGVTWTSSPHPNWQPGDKQPHPFESDKIRTLDPAELPASEAYPLAISAVVPRPIAFISSVDENGVGNVSPYSYFNVMAHDPIMITIGHAHAKGKHPGGRKDSLHNIMETGEFVVAIMSEWFLEAANHTCGPYDNDVNEMELANLTPVPSERVKAPRIGEAAVNMECKMRSHYDVVNSKGETTCTIIIAEVILMHLLEEVCGETPTGKTIVDINKLRPTSRFGGNIYGITSHAFEIPRPPAEAQERLKPAAPKTEDFKEDRTGAGH